MNNLQGGENMDIKTKAIGISNHLERLESYSETQEIVYRRDIEGFSNLCKKLCVPAEYIPSLKAILFPPLTNLSWPLSPPKPPV